MISYNVEAKNAVAPIVDVAYELNYRRRLPAIYLLMASYLHIVEERHNEDEWSRYRTEAMRIAQEEKDYVRDKAAPAIIQIVEAVNFIAPTSVAT
jgi:hypothetical protein